MFTTLMNYCNAKEGAKDSYFSGTVFSRYFNKAIAVDAYLIPINKQRAIELDFS